MYPYLPQDFCKIQAFLELMLNEYQNIVVDLSDDDLDPIAFEIILDHMRLVRLFRCGFADPGPLELPEDPQLKTAVEHALKVLRVDAHSY